MPNKDATRKMIQRARNAISGAPSNPSSLQDIVFPASYQMYKGEQFLLVDSGAIEPDNERIVIFGKQSYQDWSQQVGRLFIDGTFSVSYSGFAFLNLLFRFVRHFSINSSKYLQKEAVECFLSFLHYFQTKAEELMTDFLDTSKKFVPI